MLGRIYPAGASVDFSPNGSRIVSAANNMAYVWDVPSLKQTIALKGHTDEVQSAAFSPDGNHIATASFDTTVRIWDSASGQEKVVLNHESIVTFVTFSPDGAFVVCDGRRGAAGVCGGPGSAGERAHSGRVGVLRPGGD